MLDLSPDQLAEVQAILRRLTPEATQVYAFGSRTQGRARKFSDLDLLIKSTAALDFTQLALLEDAFSESNLPFRVDLIDWYAINDEFREAILPHMQIIQGDDAELSVNEP